MSDISPVIESLSHSTSDPTMLRDQQIRGTPNVVDCYSMATHSFQENLNWIEKEGQKDSPAWHLANGLLRLVQGLQQDYAEREDRLRSFARSEQDPK